MLPSNADDYIFSFAGRAQADEGAPQITETERTYASTFSVAIAKMLQEYVDRDLQEKLLEAEREWEEERADDESIDI